MATGVRINSPRNFRGELYATEEYVKDTIKETVALPEGVDSLIDPERIFESGYHNSNEGGNSRNQCD